MTALSTPARELPRLNFMDPGIQGTWKVTRYRAGDEMVAPQEGSEPFLVFEGGRVAGHMGVNRLTGDFGSGFPLGPLATTRMAGPPELMAQEDVLHEHLQTADGYAVVGGGMFLTREGLLLIELVESGTEQPAPTS